LALLLGATAASAAPRADQARLVRLNEQVFRAEAVRAIKRLHHAYVHYAQMGMWRDVADLFSRDARLVRGGETIVGRDRIHAYLLNKVGEGREGLAPGRLRVELLLSPVITLGPDARTAKGRWHEMVIDARYKQRADWNGGIQVNDYVYEDGAWKIAQLHYHPQFEGPYLPGWRNVDANPQLVPYHYTVDQAGTPSIALPEGFRPATSRGATLSALGARVQRLNDETAILNLQNAYGYYVDRRMWDDVADLFAEDGTLEAAEGPRLAGRRSIRSGLEGIAPAGLRAGELYDHLQLDPVVTIDPSGTVASARGIELGMIGTNGGQGFWTITLFENRYVKRNGKWMVAAMRLYPRTRTDYHQGWATSALPHWPLAGSGVDKASALQFPKQGFPAFSFRNPVTGRAPRIPATIQLVRWDDPASARRAAKSGGAGYGSLDEIERELARAAAYDAAENISTAYGYYIDEFRWREMADLFSANGWKELSYIGTYVGRERVYRSAASRYNAVGRVSPYLAIHQKVQPVIHVAPDARSARMHMRLFQLGSDPKGPGAFIGGHYENEAVLENGIWRISAMDLDYVWLSSYANGWTRVAPGAARQFAPKPDAMAHFPPDRPLRGPAFAPFPDLEPIPFHFRNPVSGREPPLLLSNAQVQ
jgi:hypothetical protein